jgi:hypothetical protein
MVEGSPTACLLVGGQPAARSSAGLTVELRMRNLESGIRYSDALFDGLAIDARVVRARAREYEDRTVALTTVASDCA